MRYSNWTKYSAVEAIYSNPRYVDIKCKSQSRDWKAKCKMQRKIPCIRLYAPY